MRDSIRIYYIRRLLLLAWRLQDLSFFPEKSSFYRAWREKRGTGMESWLGFCMNVEYGGRGIESGMKKESLKEALLKLMN